MGFVSARPRQILINSITPLNIFLAFLYICLGALPGDSRTTWHVFVYTMLEELRIWGPRGRRDGFGLILKEMSANWESGP